MFYRLVPILLLTVVVSYLNAGAQCSTLGQTPQTAFPVCGSSVFKQTNVPACFNGAMYSPGCVTDGIFYNDANPYYYKFTCFKSGSLGFTIAPNVASDDYDWQLFDVTGLDPSIIFSTNPATGKSISVSSNWSGTTGGPTAGRTGTSTSASNLFVCGTSNNNPDPPLISKAPLIFQGHNYILMVSHFSGDDQSGYSLSFGGGTASITDTVPPRLASALINCAGTKIAIKLNKKMMCSSLSPDGSDFRLSTGLSKVTSATAKSCRVGFDMDSIVLTLDKELPDGYYTVYTQVGNDENTIQDLCLNQVPVNDSGTVSIFRGKPTPFDSLSKVGCAPNILQLVFSKNIQCRSIEPNGSDFVVTGTSPVKVIGAYANCDEEGLSNVIYIKLDGPINLKGDYQVKLVTGSDGSTIIDECNIETPAGGTLGFVTKDTVSANFSSQVLLGCERDTIVLAHNGNNEVNNWQWLFDDGTLYTTQNVTRTYPDYGTKTVILLVSNGLCTDSLSRDFLLDNQIISRFTTPPFLCPGDKAVFIDSSIGKITGWSWYFSNGSGSTQQNPLPQAYPTVRRDSYYPVQLVIKNDLPCYDTSYQELKILYNCYIAVPSAFTPNADGVNDYLYPLNAYKATGLEFKVYNRWGQQVFATRDWTRKWDGTLNGIKQASGVYAWYLSYSDGDAGQKHFLKGTTVLIR